MQSRDRHFRLGGSELDAPQYIYFDKMIFMREFSIKKEPYIEPARNDVLQSPNISPENLVYEEVKENGNTTYTDFTEEFIENVRKFPILFDENAEMRKYRSKEAWKKISDCLGGRFTVGKMRQYWTTLIRKYKLYLASSPHYAEIENEALFDNLYFVNTGIQIKGEQSTTQYMLQLEGEIDSSRELEEINEEHLLCEEVDDDIDSVGSSGEVDEQTEVIQDEPDDETARAVEAIEEIVEPSPKKLKIEPKNDCHLLRINKPVFISNLKSLLPQQSIAEKSPPSASMHSTPIPISTTNEDEFDYFGKKVALQLRELAQKNRSAARKGEIKVLQLLMELEEGLDS